MAYLYRIASAVLTLAFLVGAVGCVAWMDHASAVMAHVSMASMQHDDAVPVGAVQIKKSAPIACTSCTTVQQIFSTATVVTPVTSLLISLGMILFVAVFFVTNPALFASLRSHAPPWSQEQVHLVQQLRAHRAVVMLR